ncbi:TPA: ATP-grasp domain-containing protein [Klebsiella pneumoniae]|nr:ATP-grasp domain-containing protein [Klebsiella pneumoniae]
MSAVATVPPHKVLVANRGEIAVRIIRACHEYGFASVAVYADPDVDSLHCRLAGEAWALPGSSPAETYLNIEQLIDVARRSEATMVHPGYGFLSERAEFARAVEAAGLIWIGPRPETIEQLGDKVQARKIAMAVGAPLVKGTPDPVSCAEDVIRFADEHGLPVAIKAAFGGGGRGLKVAWFREEIATLYQSAVSEALTAFGRGECYVEQYLDRPRHIEAQVIADEQGHVVVVGTRDCSLQRRNQKLVEEAPAPFLSAEIEAQIASAAQSICQRAGYRSAGTVEFLLGANGVLSFLEVNTRLQVEHPITEETSGLDLVKEQLRVAHGLPLSITTPPVPRGHAIELRINAEDPAKGFLPVPGTITRFDLPGGPGVRVDSGVTHGDTISGFYDSLMAKLVIWAPDRDQTLARARQAVKAFRIEGVASVLPFHEAVLHSPDFTKSFSVHTRWIETDFSAELAEQVRPLPPGNSPLQRCWIEIDGRRHQLALPASFQAASGSAVPASLAETPQALQVAGAVTAPISGIVQRWLKTSGETVSEGETLAVMEAMKMEVPVLAARNGVLSIQIAAGESCQQDGVLGKVTP